MEAPEQTAKQAEIQEYNKQEINAVKTILAAYFHPETTVDKGEGVTAFIMELADITRKRDKFIGLLRLAKDSPSALLELEAVTRAAFRAYVMGEEAYLNQVTEEDIKTELQEPMDEIESEEQSKAEVE